MNEIDRLIQDKNAVAISVSQRLEPMEGRQSPIYPATYPAAEKQGHRFDTPYNINQLKDGRMVATLDSVQSQANRMEAAFVGELAHAVPKVTVAAGDRVVMLTELPHRLADAVIRASELHDAIRDAFEAYDAGDPSLIAKLGPTSLVYGAWDSRDTRVKIPRLIRSEIHAWDVDIFTRSAQFSGTFSREELGFSEKEWKKGADIGFAPTPSVDAHGGVMVNGEIRQVATVHLGQCRALERSTPGLGIYVLGLALAGLWTGGRDYTLRTGCWLVPDGAPEVSIVDREGQRTPLALSTESILEFLNGPALTAARQLEIPLGEGGAISANFDIKAGKALLTSKGDA